MAGASLDRLPSAEPAHTGHPRGGRLAGRAHGLVRQGLLVGPRRRGGRLAPPRALGRRGLPAEVSVWNFPDKIRTKFGQFPILATLKRYLRQYTTLIEK